MGFGDVLAGNVYKAPEEATASPATPTAADNEVTATVTAAGSPPPGLSQEGREAAKALVGLPKEFDAVAMAKLARDIAMDIKERHAILKEHGLTQAQYDYLETYNTFFKHALEAASI